MNIKKWASLKMKGIGPRSCPSHLESRKSPVPQPAAALLILVSALTWPLWVNAADQCGTAEAIRAEATTDQLKTWPEIYAGFSRYHRCDDGGIAEGFSEAVVHQLASDWGSLAQGAAIMRKHTGFRRFVLRHIDATTNDDDLERIRQLSSADCPRDIEDICRDIHTAAERAIKESNEAVNAP
jgi:hypothetical protein